jgi:hypothetical protein
MRNFIFCTCSLPVRYGATVFEEPWPPFHILYSSPNIIRQIIKENEVGRTCGTHGRGEESLQVLFRVVLWDILPCKIILDQRFRGAFCRQNQGTHLWNVDRQSFYTAVGYIPKYNSEHHTRRRENLKSHIYRFWLETPKDRDDLEDQDTDGRRTPWTKVQPIARLPPTQDSRIQKMLTHLHALRRART